MTSIVEEAFQSIAHLFFPHYCMGCKIGLSSRAQLLCYSCAQLLPATKFFQLADNPVERSFYGRLHIANAAAAFYFSKDSLLHDLLVEMKYLHNKNAGYYLGKLMAYQILMAKRFETVDALIPLPLHPKKFAIRGYNQAELICQGISEVWNKPIITNAVARTSFSETQTHRNRISRWQNMNGIFSLAHPEIIAKKHVLLIDDVTTTGATLEACGKAILMGNSVTLSIATLAFTP
jgi:ComF family protein